MEFRTRGPQYTKNDTDLYVSGVAEEELDDGNPFNQNNADEPEPIPDKDEAAAAAIMSRDENAESNGQHNNNDNNEDQEKANYLNQPRTTNIFLREGDPATPLEPENTNTNLDLADPLQVGGGERRKSASKHPRGLVGDTLAGEAGDADEPSDPEVRRLVKKARRDSRALPIQPEDDADEQDRKMRANLDLSDPLIEDDDDSIPENVNDAKDERQKAEDQDFDRPTEVEPIPLIDKISEHKDHEPVVRDAGDEDDDIEDRGDDDYDVENYAEFEDDDDDMEGPDRDRFREGDAVIDEEELR